MFLLKLCRQNIFELSDEGRAACLPALRVHYPCWWPRPAEPVSSVWWHHLSQWLLSWARLVLLPQHPVLCFQAWELPPGRGHDNGHDQGEGVRGHSVSWMGSWWMLPPRLCLLLSWWTFLCNNSAELSIVNQINRRILLIVIVDNCSWQNKFPFISVVFIKMLHSAT